MMRTTRWLLGLAVAVCGCTADRVPPASNPSSPTSFREWSQARQTLDGVRNRWQPRPGTMRLRVAWIEPATGRQMLGRGAVHAVPPEAMRLVLVNPAGLTMFDLWVRGRRWRLAFPSQERILRGDTNGTGSGSTGGLPVWFLRWWFLHRLDGRLLAASLRDGDRQWVLSHEGRIVTVRATGSDELEVTRRSAEGSERIVARHPGCGTASYENTTVGVRLEIACEGMVDVANGNARALRDPDAPAP